jgi:hypothetical protein
MILAVAAGTSARTAIPAALAVAAQVNMLLAVPTDAYAATFFSSCEVSGIFFA